MPGHTRIRGGSCHIRHKDYGYDETDRKDPKDPTKWTFSYTLPNGKKIKLSGDIPKGEKVELRWHK